MLMELGYRTLVSGQQEQFSIQGYDISELIVFLSDEGLSEQIYCTVRTQTATLVERIPLSIMHQISDYHSGNAPGTSLTPGFVGIDLGFLSLGDNEEMSVNFDITGTITGAKFIGCAVEILDVPGGNEQTFHYAQHTDTSFNATAAAALYVFKPSISASSELINYKLGEDSQSTTLRSTNWQACINGQIEADNVTMGVVFDNDYGQAMTVNTAATGVTYIVKRIHQVDSDRKSKVASRIAKKTARKLRSLDAQSFGAL